jgi:hypothetical protein
MTQAHVDAVAADSRRGSFIDGYCSHCGRKHRECAARYHAALARTYMPDPETVGLWRKRHG